MPLLNYFFKITENTNQSEISGTSEITPLLENARGFQWRKLTIRRIIFALLTLVLLEMKFSFLWQYLSPEHDIFPVTKLTPGNCHKKSSIYYSRNKHATRLRLPILNLKLLSRKIIK